MVRLGALKGSGELGQSADVEMALASAARG